MSLFHRLFPHPLLTVLLTVVWLMMVNEYTINSLLFGFLLATIIPFATRSYWPHRPKLRNPLMVVEFVLVVLWDIVIANITVARLVLFQRNADFKPAYISVPLELKSPEAITVLAGTITMTPGTVTSDISNKGHSLLVHCLHAPDPDAIRDEIKTRYERRLKEIFE